ncbi:MAG: hypothetical protein F2789_16695, partial [Actinobacteria bacterium]|nr:hypothetical protein [Actinomycetota bacterium]
MRRGMVLIAAGVLGAAALAGCSSSSKTATTTGGGGGVTVAPAAGTPVAVEAGDKSDTLQYLTPVPAEVKAGSTTFTLTNTSTTKKHEMVVLKTD